MNNAGANVAEGLDSIFIFGPTGNIILGLVLLLVILIVVYLVGFLSIKMKAALKYVQGRNSWRNDLAPMPSSAPEQLSSLQALAPRKTTSTRRYLLNVLVAFVPDFIVCWIASRLTDSGSSGFFIALIALQVVYFFFWFKNALWSWLLFWIYNKRQMAKFAENYFIDNHFPVPGEYSTDVNDYLSDLTNNEELDCTIRMKAAGELGAIEGLRIAHKFSLLLQLNLAYALALKRYGHLAKRFTRTESRTQPRRI